MNKISGEARLVVNEMGQYPVVCNSLEEAIQLAQAKAKLGGKWFILRPTLQIDIEHNIKLEYLTPEGAYGV